MSVQIFHFYPLLPYQASADCQLREAKQRRATHIEHKVVLLGVPVSDDGVHAPHLEVGGDDLHGKGQREISNISLLPK